MPSLRQSARDRSGLPTELLLTFDPGVLRLAPLAGERVGSHPTNLIVRVFEQRDHRLGGLFVAVQIEVLATSPTYSGARTLKAQLHRLNCLRSRCDERPQRRALVVRYCEGCDDFIEGHRFEALYAKRSGKTR